MSGYGLRALGYAEPANYHHLRVDRLAPQRDPTRPLLAIRVIRPAFRPAASASQPDAVIEENLSADAGRALFIALSHQDGFRSLAARAVIATRLHRVQVLDGFSRILRAALLVVLLRFKFPALVLQHQPVQFVLNFMGFERLPRLFEFERFHLALDFPHGAPMLVVFLVLLASLLFVVHFAPTP